MRSVTLPASDTSPGGTWTYANDALGRRIVRRAPDGTTTKLLYSGMRRVALFDGSDAVLARYVYGRARLAPELIITPSTTYRVLCDHLGSPRLLVDAAGDVAERNDYGEYGERLPPSTGAVSENIFGFANALRAAPRQVVSVPVTQFVGDSLRTYGSVGGAVGTAVGGSLATAVGDD